MAFLDDINRAVVLRVVYSGPPMSGKTETVRALARILLGTRHPDAVFTPDEASGRTLFFDWLEYSAGSFQGRRIRCQIVSVPGQMMLAQRRRTLLESADAVVFVVDAHREHAGTILKYYREMQGFIAKGEEDTPVGVIVQANKSDLPEAMDRPELLQLLGDDANLAVVATVATGGAGVREAFVQAVGLGLARVHDLLGKGRVESGEVDIDSGIALLERLKTIEENQFGPLDHGAAAAPSLIDAADVGGQHLVAEQLGAIVESQMERLDGQRPAAKVPQPEKLDGHAVSRRPQAPSEGVGAGMVWPPIAGRIILHELSANPPELDQRDGCWAADTTDGWRLMSLDAHRFGSEIEAREQMLQLARQHSGFKSLLSEHRCVICSASGGDDWRIWQIVRRETTLANIAESATHLQSPETIASELLGIGDMLCAAALAFREARFPGRPALDALAVSHGKPVFAGFVPMSPEAVVESDVAKLLRRELNDAVATLSRRADIVPRLLRLLEASKRFLADAPPVAENLIAMFLHHD